MSKLSSTAIGVQFFTIGEDQAGQRMDNYLMTRLKGVPKSRIYRLLRKGEIRVNKKRTKPDYRLCPGDAVRVAPIRLAETPPVPVPGAALRTYLERNVLLATDDYLVLDKPAGLAVHGGSGVELGLIEALRQARVDPYLELVHRLDRGTSGCLLVARKRSALRSLQGQLRAGKVRKVYLALVAGRWPRGLDRIDAPLSKNRLPSGEPVVKADAEGKNAGTGFKPVAWYRHATLMEVHLETGRTHQIRVHCQLAGYPLAGDEKYGVEAVNTAMKKRGLNRIFLHAYQLGFTDPASGERVTVESPLPAELRAVLEGMGDGKTATKQKDK